MAAVRGMSDEEFFGTAPLTPQVAQPDYVPPRLAPRSAAAPDARVMSDADFYGPPSNEPRDVSLLDRLMVDFRHEAYGGTNAAVTRNLDNARVRQLMEWHQPDAAARVLRGRARENAEMEADANITGWNDGPSTEAMLPRLAKAAAAGVGTFTGFGTNVVTNPTIAISRIPYAGEALSWAASKGLPLAGRFAEPALEAVAPRVADLFEKTTGFARPGVIGAESAAAPAVAAATESAAPTVRKTAPELFERGTGVVRPGAVEAVTVRPTTREILKEAAAEGGTQGVVQTATNPFEQKAKVSTGLQQEFDPLQFALSPLMGFGFGAALHMTASSGAVFRNLLEKARGNRAAKGIPPDAPVSAEEMAELEAQPEYKALTDIQAKQGPLTREDATGAQTPQTEAEFYARARPVQGPQTREQFAQAYGPEQGPPTAALSDVRVGDQVQGPPIQSLAERLYGPAEGPPTREQYLATRPGEQGPPIREQFMADSTAPVQGPPTFRQSGTGPVEGPPTRADALGQPGWRSPVDMQGRPLVPERTLGETLASLPERPLDPMGPPERPRLAGEPAPAPREPFDLAPIMAEINAGKRLSREEFGPPTRDAKKPYAPEEGPPTREAWAAGRQEQGPPTRDQFIAEDGRPMQGPKTAAEAHYGPMEGPPTREAVMQARTLKEQGPSTREGARQAAIAANEKAGLKPHGPPTLKTYEENVAAAKERHAARLEQIKADEDARLQRELDDLSHNAVTEGERARAVEQQTPRDEHTVAPGTARPEPKADRPVEGPPRGVQNEQHFEAQQRAHDAGTETAAEDLPPPVRGEHAEPAPQPARDMPLETEPAPSISAELPRDAVAGVGGERGAEARTAPGADVTPHAPTTDPAFEAQQRSWDATQQQIDDEVLAHAGLTQEDRNAWKSNKAAAAERGAGESAEIPAANRQSQSANPATREGAARDNAGAKGGSSAVDREASSAQHGGSESVTRSERQPERGELSEPADRPASAEPGERKSETSVTKKEKAKDAVDLKSQFSSNPVFDPAIWKSLYRSAVDTFGMDKPSANRWAQTLKDNWNLAANELKAGKFAGFAELGRRHFYTADGELRFVGAAAKSPVIKKIADHLFVAARFGKEAVGEDYFQALYARQKEWGNRVSKVMKPWRGQSDAQQAEIGRQITRLVQNPSQLAGKADTDIGRAALEVQKVLKDIHKYLTDAGVDLGKVPDGYFPRVENSQAILKDPEGFLKQAEKAYLASGVEKGAAKEAAEAWLARVRTGDWASHQQGGNGITTFTKGRTLSKEADNIMRDYLLQNPGAVLQSYISRAAKKAEFSRRFGKREAGAVPPLDIKGDHAALETWRNDPQGKWKDMMLELRKEGNGHLEQKVTEIVRGITGDYASIDGIHGSGQRVAQMARTFVALSHMSKAVLTSLSEPVINAVHTGNTLDILSAYGETIRQWVPILRKEGDGAYLREFGEDAGYIGDGIDSTTMMDRAGGENSSLFLRRVTDSYFRSTGLTQFTEATRVASIRIGMRFMRRLAKDVESGGTYANISRRLFAEMGIGKETVKGGHADPVLEFSKWLSALDKPTVGELRGHGEFGKLYETALGRFVNRSVQHPTGALRPHLANKHPLGSLIYGLQSFNFAFQKNVLSRVGAGVKTALDRDNELNMHERAYALMPLVNMGALVAVTYAMGEARDAVFADPARKGKDISGAQKVGRTFSRAGLTGSFDPLFNFATGSKWQGTLVDALAGPAAGDFARGVGSATNFGKQFVDGEDAKNNNVDRQFAKDSYNLAVQPGMAMAVMSGLPVIGIGGRIVGAAAAYGMASPQARESFVVGTAGEKDDE